MTDIAQIRSIKKAAQPDIMKRPGVTGVSIGEKITNGQKTGETAIIVYVEKKHHVEGEDQIPTEIDGVKTDVVQRSFKANAFVPVQELRPAIDATRYAQLRGGMSIGPCRSIFLEPPDAPAPGNYIFVGTLGAIVNDNGTGDPMLLTNFHVAAVNNSWSTSDSMAQPGRPDGGSCPADAVGTLTRALVQGTTAGGGPGVDCAVISVNGNRPTDCSIVSIGDVRGTAVASEGMAVRKRGRTTELTFGNVSSIDATVAVDFGDGIGVVVFEDQIEIEVDSTQSAAFGISGDSGSVVVNDAERVVGLYFAGNVEETDALGNVITPEGVIGIANPIAAVESALNVTICAKPFKKLEIKENIKEFKELGEGKSLIKELIKDSKEFKEFGPKEFKEFGPKELKEQIKDFKEPKEIFEDKRFEDKRFEGKQFEGKQFEGKQFEDKRLENKAFEDKRLEGKPFEGGPSLPGFPGQTPGGGLPGFEDRLSRLESVLGLMGQGGVQPSAGFGCIDFASMPPGPTPNPLNLNGVDFLALDHAGAPWPNPGIKNFGSVTGLDTGFRMQISLPMPCPAIRITLAHFSSPPTVEIFDAAGTAIGSQTLTAAQGVPETITLPSGPVAGGGGVALLVVSAPQNEALITEFCCLEEQPKQPKPEKLEKLEKLEMKEKFEKPELKDKAEKEKPEKIEKPELKDKPEKTEKPEAKDFKDGPKELKEIPKELKEFKELEPKRIKEVKELEPKRFKEGKELEPKRLKEFKEFEPKRVKEYKETAYEKGFEKPTDKALEGPTGPQFPGAMEDRLARVEAAMGGATGHFIDPGLRPDLSTGALRREPDANTLGDKVSKDASDTKQSKDLKDSEKPREA